MSEEINTLSVLCWIYLQKNVALNSKIDCKQYVKKLHLKFFSGVGQITVHEPELSCHWGISPCSISFWNDLCGNFPWEYQTPTRTPTQTDVPAILERSLTVWDPNSNPKKLSTLKHEFPHSSTFIPIFLFSQTNQARNEYPTPAIWAS